MTSDQFKRARQALGMIQKDFANALGLGSNGYRTVQRIEAGALITGPMSLAVQKLLDDHKAKESES